tara:strand:- start:270 stop:743 length:474 start_codon:yes stop_codon:yes gene_type:complete
MKQRVSLQYSIELDNLENETDRLFDNISRQIQLLGTATNSRPNSLSMDALDFLGELQTHLQSISIAADDLQKIISGFLSFKLQDEQTQQDAGPSEDLPTTSQLNDEDRETLREQINEYRKVLEHAVSVQQSDPEIVDEEIKRQKIESFKEKQAASIK